MEDVSMFRDRGFRKTAPLEEGQELEVTIEAVGEKGDGIAKSKGFVIFVPGVRQGDHVRVRVTKVLRNFSFGEVIGPAQEGSSRKTKQEAEQEEGQEDDMKPEAESQEEEMTTKAQGEDDDDFGGDDDADEEDNQEE